MTFTGQGKWPSNDPFLWSSTYTRTFEVTTSATEGNSASFDYHAISTRSDDGEGCQGLSQTWREWLNPASVDAQGYPIGDFLVFGPRADGSYRVDSPNFGGHGSMSVVQVRCDRGSYTEAYDGHSPACSADMPAGAVDPATDELAGTIDGNPCPMGFADEFGALSWRLTRSTDADNDGVGDDKDQCPNTPPDTPVTDYGCSDADQDGVDDDQDECAGTPVGTTVDFVGCPNSDSDQDGVSDDQDQCPNTPTGTSVDLTGCPVAQACSDSFDNDGDGRSDFPDDPGCESVDDSSENGSAQCDDGEDNDGDHLIDYPSDDGCDSLTDDTELHCEKKMVVVVPVPSSYPNPDDGACWDWRRASRKWGYPDGASSGVGEKAGNCLYKDQIWAYDEFTFDRPKSDDQKYARKCAKHFAGYEGAPVFAFSPDRHSWPVGHWPKSTGGLPLLELYNGQHIVDPEPYGKWHGGYRPGYGPVINVGGIGTDQAVHDDLLQACQDARSVIGVYSGRNEASRLTVSRREAIIEALDDCTQ
jgi:hypothetical protein